MPGADFSRLQEFAHTYHAQPLGFDQIRPQKVAWIAEIGSASSIRDFGGLWGVFGHYLIEGAKALKCVSAEMVDVTPRVEFEQRVAEARRTLDCTFTMVQADFRSPELYARLQPMDVSLLYEVLLHQENYVDVIGRVLGVTSRSLLVAQPVIKESLFHLPASCTLLQFFPIELKREIPIQGWLGDEPAVERFDTRYWMWGHTVSHLKAVVHGFGWNTVAERAFEMSPHWDFALLRFEPRDSRSGLAT